MDSALFLRPFFYDRKKITVQKQKRVTFLIPRSMVAYRRWKNIYICTASGLEIMVLLRHFPLLSAELFVPMEIGRVLNQEEKNERHEVTV